MVVCRICKQKSIHTILKLNRDCLIRAFHKESTNLLSARYSSTSLDCRAQLVITQQEKGAYLTSFIVNIEKPRGSRYDFIEKVMLGGRDEFREFTKFCECEKALVNICLAASCSARNYKP